MVDILKKFIVAQDRDFEKALNEISNGEKTSHWIWYIFPQLKGLGHSFNSDYYGLRSLEEAKEYLKNPILSERIHEISKQLLKHQEKDIKDIMGSDIDAMKLKSSMTLFDLAEPNGIFNNVLKTFYNGSRCSRTLSLLGIKVNIVNQHSNSKTETSTKSDKRISPSRIDILKANEIFVFGSNLLGHHAGGAARVALDKFGAIWGKGVGLQGQSYAIPTMHGGTDVIKPYVDEFIEFAKENKHLNFMVTRIGCGIAGFDDKDIAPLFKEAVKIENIYLPLSFLNVLENKVPADTQTQQEHLKVQYPTKKESISDKIKSFFSKNKL